MIGQVRGEFQAKEPQLQKYLVLVKEIMRELEKCAMEHIPREQNSRADLLSKLASTRMVANNRLIIQEVIEEPSYRPPLPQRR